MRLRRFKEDSPMDQADHMLEWLMEVSNVAFYCDLSASKRRLICKELVDWRRKAVREHARTMADIREMNRLAKQAEAWPACCFAGVGRACPRHEGGAS
jgi:hypothetical protein